MTRKLNRPSQRTPNKPRQMRAINKKFITSLSPENRFGVYANKKQSFQTWIEVHLARCLGKFNHSISVIWGCHSWNKKKTHCDWTVLFFSVFSGWWTLVKCLVRINSHYANDPAMISAFKLHAISAYIAFLQLNLCWKPLTVISKYNFNWLSSCCRIASGRLIASIIFPRFLRHLRAKSACSSLQLYASRLAH